MALNLGTIFYQLGVNTAGLNRADREVKTFQSSANKSFSSVNSTAKILAGTLATVVSLESLRRSINLTDNYGLLKDRIVAVTGSISKATPIFSKLEKISAKTGASLEVTAGGFQKLYFAKDTVKATDTEIVRLTQSFAELGQISGTGIAQLDAAMLQFSQGLVTGTFQAQEFQSVLENVPAIAPQIAKGMGITVAELIKLKKEGKLVSEEVFRALVIQADDISEIAAKLPMRFSRGFSRFTLGIQQGLAGLDEAYGLTLKLGQFFFDAGEKAAKLPVYVEATISALKKVAAEHKTLTAMLVTFVAIKAAVIGINVSLSVMSAIIGFISTKINVFTVLAATLFVFRKEIEAAVSASKDLLKAFKDLIAGNPLNMLHKLATFDFSELKKNYQDALTPPNAPANTPNAPGDLNKPDLSFLEKAKAEFKAFIADFNVSDLGPINTLFQEIERLNKEHLAKQKAMEEQGKKDSEDQAKQKAYAIIKWEEYKNRITDTLKRTASKESIDIAGQSFRKEIEMAGQYSKQFADLTKALAVFDILVKTPEAVASAFAWGTSIGGPPVGFLMGGIASAAMGAQLAGVMSQNFTPRAVGGEVFPGGSYLVGENGPEILNMGVSARGSITPNSSIGNATQSGGMPSVTVNVYPIEGETATVTQTQDSNGGMQLDIMIEKIDSKLAEGISRGTSRLNSALTNTFGLNRALGARA